MEGHRLLESHTNSVFTMITMALYYLILIVFAVFTVGYQHMCSLGACFPSSRCFSQRVQLLGSGGTGLISMWELTLAMFSAEGLCAIAQ